MIEPLNYLRQAQEDLAQKWLPFARRHHPKDAQQGLSLLQAARGAPKFVLPRGGRLLNDRLKGLPRQPKLPFETLVLEYESDAEGQGIVEQVYERKPVSCPRRVVVAWQDGHSICVQALFYLLTGEGYASWTVTPYFAELCFDEAQEPAEVPTYHGKPVLPHLLEKNTPASNLALRFHAVGTIAEQSSDDWRGSAYLDLLDEINAVLELIEALSCSNVHHEALPVRKLNKSAAKRGALPFDEYRVLVVRGPSGEAQEPVVRVGNGHRSPREHLRRGHIRIYESGRQIWINPTLVNAGVGGRVSTVRDMRRAA